MREKDRAKEPPGDFNTVHSGMITSSRLVVLLFGLVCAVFDLRSVHGSTRTVVRHCCDIGRQWFMHSDRSCPSHPMIDNARDRHSPCLLAVEICCTAELRKQRCSEGRRLALQGEPMDDSSDDAKECYSCCRLGMRAKMDHKGCQKLPRSHLFTSQCRQSFAHCCSPESVDNSTLPSRGRDPCINGRFHCSPTERCLPDRTRGFVCVPIKGGAENQDGSRTTPRSTTTPDLTGLRGNGVTCRDGFVFRVDSMECEDIDECQELTHACDSFHVCWNEPGSYKCLPQSNNIDNDLLKVQHNHRHHHNHRHQHRHAGVQPSIHHRPGSRETADDYDDKHGLSHKDTPPTFHSQLDANDESVGITGALTTRVDREKENSFAKDPIHDEATAKSSQEAESHLIDTTKEIFKPAFELREMCQAGQQYNKVKGICEVTAQDHVAPPAKAMTTFSSDANGCDDRKCRDKNMVCREKLGKEFCTCKPGFKYDPRAESCRDVDECSGGNHGCRGDEVCHNTLGSYSCLTLLGNCHRGFFYDTVSSRCTDLDECASNLHNCPPPLICSNLPGSFQCLTPSCGQGMILDQLNGCVPDPTLESAKAKNCNMDQSLCLEDQVCVNIDGEYMCRNLVSCRAGLQLNADVNQCQDIDECDEGTHNCTGHHMYCINNVGGFSCNCTQGYVLSALHPMCEDIDECSASSNTVCPFNAKCTNTPGSYLCSCELGYQIRGTSRQCTDINECSTGIHSCEQECLNTMGSYYCSCQEGFELNSDGFTCSDLDECSMGDECLSRGEMCVNTWGGHHCHPITCPSGFVRQHLSGQWTRFKKPVPERNGDYKQVHLSLFPQSDQKPPVLSRHSYGLQNFSMRHRRSASGHGFQTGKSHFLSSWNQGPDSPHPIVLMVNENADVVCKKVPCSPGNLWCQNNSTRSMQWHQVLLPLGRLDPRIPIITIIPSRDPLISRNSFQIIGGNEGSTFEVRRVVDQSRDRGDVHAVRIPKGRGSWELVVSVRNIGRDGGTVSEHIMHIIISTTPQSVT